MIVCGKLLNQGQCFKKLCYVNTNVFNVISDFAKRSSNVLFHVHFTPVGLVSSRGKCYSSTERKSIIFFGQLKFFISNRFMSEYIASVQTVEKMDDEKDPEVDVVNTQNQDSKELKTVEEHTGCQKRKQEDLGNNKAKKTKKSLRPGFGEDRFCETEYYFENGLRKVYPYYFPYSTYCKGRWVGQHLLDVLLNEFGAYTKEQYEQFIKLGTLTINKEAVSYDYVLKNNDFVTNIIHRHETPVLAAPLKIIHKTDDIIVLDKPPSIPVHPCGRYRHNSVTFILGKEHNLRNLHSKPLTGRTHQIRVHLQYLGYPIVNDPLYNTELFGPSKGKGGEFGKPREEVIKLITDTHTVNKWLVEDSDSEGYGVFPPSDCKDENSAKDMTNSSILVENGTAQKETLPSSRTFISKPLETCPLSSQLSHYTDSCDFLKLAEKYQFDINKVAKDSSCAFCKLNLRDPKAQDLIMFLHAYRYSGEGFDFQTEIPRWAKEDWTEN